MKIDLSERFPYSFVKREIDTIPQHNTKPHRFAQNTRKHPENHRLRRTERVRAFHPKVGPRDESDKIAICPEASSAVADLFLKMRRRCGDAGAERDTLAGGHNMAGLGPRFLSAEGGFTGECIFVY